MQYDFSLLPLTAAACERAISSSRMAKYIAEAKGDRALAFRLYLWNNSLCAAMYGPIQLAEVSIRNAISIPIQRRFGATWHLNPKFIGILNHRMKDELKKAVSRELKQHGKATTAEHITSALTFGFWVGLMTSAMDRQLWSNGIHNSFPNAPKHYARPDIHREIDEIREIRNDIMHYKSIFDKKPTTTIEKILTVTKYVSDELYYAAIHSNVVATVISQKPAN